ncbi:hypothetical protein [Sorangium sp. So ce542]|uniref:hypothetical protein n=1 Tax=Sorangium sp. So ce542 TaxID=3133316 RepID=UPI003F643AAC
MGLLPIAYLCLTGAMVLAWATAWRRREHRPVALFLSLALAADLGRRALRLLVLVPAREALRAQGLDPTRVPFTGLVRVAADAEGALFVAWRAGLAALAVWVFTRRRPWAVLVAYVLAVGFMVATYPRGAELQRFYLATELASLCVALGCLLLWFRSDEKLNLQTLCAGIIVSVGLANVTGGPYFGDIFLSWERAQQILIVMYLALVAVQGVSLWRSRASM